MSRIEPTSYLLFQKRAPACHPERRRREGPGLHHHPKQVLRCARVPRASLRMTGLLAFVRKEEEKKAPNYSLPFSREYDVRRARRRHMLSARITQPWQIDPHKQMLPTAEQDRRDRHVHLVDEPRLEILPQRGNSSDDLDIEVARGLPGELERFLNPAGDEMKNGPAFHRDRLARVPRQHEHRRMIGRILPPPAAPLIVAPRPALGAEHVAAHDPGTDPLPGALGKIVVETCRPSRLSLHLAKRARVDKPAVQVLTSDAEWVLAILARTGA